MTAALIESPSVENPSGCRFAWCLGAHCTARGPHDDRMHQGRDTTVHDAGWEHDLYLYPMRYEWTDGTESGPLVEFVINNADTGYGTCVSCPPDCARAAATALLDACRMRSGIGQVITINSPGAEGCAAGVITVERLDEFEHFGWGSAGHTYRSPLIKLTVRGEGETDFEECKLRDADAFQIARFVMAVADEVDR